MLQQWIFQNITEVLNVEWMYCQLGSSDFHDEGGKKTKGLRNVVTSVKFTFD